MMLRKAIPIRYILLGAFLLTGLLPTTLITGMAFYEARIALKTEIQRDMQTHAEATAAEIDRMLFERLQNTVSWSRLEVMQDARIGDVDKRISNFLSELKNSYQDVYTELYVVDRRGMVIASSNPYRSGQPAPRLTHWLDTRVALSHVRLAGIVNQQLPILIEIEDEFSDEPLGTLVTLFDWRQIEAVLSGAVAGRSAAALFDRQNNLLSNTDRWFKTEAAKKLSASAITTGYQGFNGFSWRVTVSQNRSQALTPVRQMAYIFAGMLIATVLLLTLVAVPVASSITRPLVRLTEFANRFMRSSAELNPPTGGPAEVDTMARAFGKMIEDLERSKENLTRAAKLAVVGEMAAALSHEVRTPLGILRSSAQLLLREPGLSEEGREVCGFIISETDRLNKLVTTLIDSARPRAPEFSATDIGELAQQCTGMLRAQAEKKRITLTCKTEEGAIAACDAEQITQVILNLLLNAIQVLPEGGHIEVAVRPDGEHILLTVADDGPGIPPEHREQVFDPFFTQRAGGIGLGLSIVRQIVGAHHGEISVGSSAMHGAEFRLRLPVVGL